MNIFENIKNALTNKTATAVSMGSDETAIVRDGRRVDGIGEGGSLASVAAARDAAFFAQMCQKTPKGPEPKPEPKPNQWLMETQGLNSLDSWWARFDLDPMNTNGLHVSASDIEKYLHHKGFTITAAEYAPIKNLNDRYDEAFKDLNNFGHRRVHLQIKNVIEANEQKIARGEKTDLVPDRDALEKEVAAAQRVCRDTLRSVAMLSTDAIRPICEKIAATVKALAEEVEIEEKANASQWNVYKPSLGLRKMAWFSAAGAMAPVRMKKVSNLNGKPKDRLWNIDLEQFLQK